MSVVGQDGIASWTTLGQERVDRAIDLLGRCSDDLAPGRDRISVTGVGDLVAGGRPASTVSAGVAEQRFGPGRWAQQAQPSGCAAQNPAAAVAEALP